VTVGEKLRRERKKQKRTLESISEKTKISLLFLIALEEDDIEKLPGGIYSRNFLRAYAVCLGLDADILTAEFHEQHDTKPTSVVHREQTSIDNRSYIQEKRRGLIMVVVFLVVVALLALVGSWLYKQWSVHQEAKKPTAFSLEVPGHADQETISAEEKTDSGSPKGSEENTMPQTNSEEDPAEEVSKTSLESAGQEDQSDPQTSDPKDEGGEIQLDSDLNPDDADDPDQAIVWPERPFRDVTQLEITNLPANINLVPSIDDLFIVFAEKEVWLEVTIDGREVTKRLLPAGAYRVYYYGSQNVISCGDFTRISLQTGEKTLSTQHINSGFRETIVFEKGALADTVASFDQDAN